MRLFRHFAAILLAILIANPLCCCIASASVEAPSSPCCAQQDAGDEHSPSEAPCSSCPVKNPRVADGGKTPVLSFFALELPFEVLFETVPRLVVEPTLTVVTADPAAARPPRLLLALQQRYLI